MSNADHAAVQGFSSALGNVMAPQLFVIRAKELEK
jgi:hypothetical protein